MGKFNLVYIDDNIDNYLSDFLYNYHCSDPVNEIVYAEEIFGKDSDYETILNNPNVRNANIIIIDDKLFEDRSVVNGKFTGEEFKIVLRKYFPFIETIVITQNWADEQVGTISKYKPENLEESPEQYYKRILTDVLENAITNIEIYRKLNDKLHSNTNWEIVIQEKILESIEGKSTFDEMTKSDIDEVINLFKEIQETFQHGE